jgi:hypothetical protein
MTLAAILAFLEANGTWILALWIAFEQFIAANQKLKSNSTLQLIVNSVKPILEKFHKPGKTE